MTLREEIDLGGSWKFYPAFEPFTGDLRWMDPDFDPKKPDSLPEERRAGWTGEFFDDQGWLDIEVPGSWNVVPESPSLYTISLELRSGGAVLDKTTRSRPT